MTNCTISLHKCQYWLQEHYQWHVKLMQEINGRMQPSSFIIFLLFIPNCHQAVFFSHKKTFFALNILSQTGFFFAPSSFFPPGSFFAPSILLLFLFTLHMRNFVVVPNTSRENFLLFLLYQTPGMRIFWCCTKHFT